MTPVRWPAIERRNSGEQYVQLKSLHKKFSKKGWLLNNVAMVWNAYHCVHGTSCLRTLSSQCIRWAIPTPARFFLEIFLWRLAIVSVLFDCYTYIQCSSINNCSNKYFCIAHPLSLPRKKIAEVAVLRFHLEKISWLLVAILEPLLYNNTATVAWAAYISCSKCFVNTRICCTANLSASKR